LMKLKLLILSERSPDEGFVSPAVWPEILPVIV